MVKSPLPTLILGASALLVSACADPGDRYAEAYPVCHDIRIPKLGAFLFDLSEDERKSTYLTPECKAALERIIPYDRASFEAAPWVMDRVNEGLQTLLGDYPLRGMPTIYGTRPAVGGVMPTDLARAFGPLSDYPDDLRKGIFNYILRQTDVVRLNFVVPKAGQSAQMMPEGDGRVMSVFKNFWDLDDPLTQIRDPFSLTATLLHEARHADGITHVTCEDPEFSDGFNCDATLAGPYGAELFYSQALIHGSGVCDPAVDGEGCFPKVPRWVVRQAGIQMCQTAKKRARNVYPELERFMREHEEETGESCESLTYNHAMQLEGLTPARYPDDHGP